MIKGKYYENIMSDPEIARKNACQAVIDRPFTRICGKPSWEEKEGLLRESRDVSMIFTQVSYDWAGEYGLLAEIEGGTKFTALTTKQYTAPVRPPAQDPGIVAGNVTDKQARSRKELNDIAKVNYAIVEGFRQGFSQNWQKALDSRYYEQLREEIFGYSRILPRQFIEHLEKKWVKLDIMVIKQLRAKFF